MMMKRIENLIFRHAAQQGIRHLARPDLASDDPTLRAVYRQLAEEFQTAPPMTLHASAPALLAGYWHAAREAYVVNPAGRALREAVAAEVSRLNTCPYCQTVHAGMFAAAGGHKAEGADLRALRAWAAATLSP
ncbi:MAG TPA: carboxymuconolactone decarboxylase, partial [Thermopetrobacter sp.]|nr:carboxymuconolactone decarboxylase [Thermopetrobacter sp.]